VIGARALALALLCGPAAASAEPAPPSPTLPPAAAVPQAGPVSPAPSGLAVHPAGDRCAQAPAPAEVLWPLSPSARDIVPGRGELFALIETERGTLRCSLDEAGAPEAVAVFVGLASGRRPWLEPGTGRWRSDPFYDGARVHRSEAGFLAAFGGGSAPEGGCGFLFQDELPAGTPHRAAGVLGFENRGPDTNGCAVYVTLAAAPWLDGRHTVLGRCGPASVLRKLPRARQVRRVSFVREAPVPPPAQPPGPAPQPGEPPPAPPAAPALPSR